MIVDEAVAYTSLEQGNDARYKGGGRCAVCDAAGVERGIAVGEDVWSMVVADLRKTPVQAVPTLIVA